MYMHMSLKKGWQHMSGRMEVIPLTVEKALIPHQNKTTTQRHSYFRVQYSSMLPQKTLNTFWKSGSFLRVTVTYLHVHEVQYIL